jgi:hypothetical protein
MEETWYTGVADELARCLTDAEACAEVCEQLLERVARDRNGALQRRVVDAEQQREAEDEQDVRDDAARERSAHHVRQAVRDRDQRDDHFRGVAEARVQQTPDARARVLAHVLRRLADQPRQRDQRERRQHEQDDFARMDNGVDDPGGRSERKRGPEESSRHARLAYRAARCQVLRRVVRAGTISL